MAVTHTATFLFTDLVGSTALSSSLAPNEADDIRRAHFQALRSAVDTTGGTEVKNLGDGLMVVFTSASRALACAAAMQQATERHNRRSGTSLGLRVGLSMGEATEEDGDFFGDPVVEAARLCSAAAGGQILTTEALKTIVGRHAGHSLRGVGALELKGLPDPVPAVELVWEPSSERHAVPLPSRLIGSTPEATFGFVGRSTEATGIEQSLKEAAASSQLRVALLGGEPGMGKTSLAAHIARRAHENGVVVTFGACEEGLGVAFHPWLTAVGHLVEHAPAALTAGLRPTHLAALRRLLPHLADRLPEADDVSADADAERFLLLDAVAAFLAAASEPDGLLLVLDDLQWADVASLQVLTHLMRSPVPTRGLVVATFRPGDLGSDHPLAGVLADLRNEPRAVRHDLMGLGDEDVVGLIEAAAGQRLDSSGIDVAHALRRETGGNPFFVVELLRHLGESGAIVQDASGQYALQGELSELDLPASVRDVVGRRLRRLGDDSVRVLSLASVIGQEFDLDVLAAMADADEDGLLDLLDAAAAAALVTELDEPAGRYRFSHALVQSTLYSELGPARRQRAHQRVAAFLEARHLPGEAAATAHHFLAAIKPADVDKAVTYARRAGDEALAALAPVDAAAWYGRGLDALELAGAAAPQRRAELMVALARAQSYAGQSEFRQTLRDAAPAVAASGDTDLLVQAALVRVPGSIGSTPDPDPDQLRLIEQALAAVGPDDSPTRARLLAVLGDEYGQAYPAEWARLATEALEMAGRIGDPDTLGWVYVTSAAGLRLDDRFEQRQKWEARVRPMLSATTDLSTRIFALDHFTENAADVLDWGEVDRLLAEMQRLADGLDLDIYRWEPLNFQAWASLTRGDVVEGERLSTAALEAGLRANLPPATASYGAQLMMHRLFTGRLDEILRDAGAVEAPLPALAVGWRLAIVWLHCQAGNLAGAETLFSEREVSPDHVPFDSVWLQSTALLGDIAVYLDRPTLAGECYRLLAPYADRFWFSGSHDVGYIARYLGRMAAALGRGDDAIDHLEFSLRMHHEKHLPYWEARSALDLAAVIRDREPGGAAELVRSALELADLHGFGGLVFTAARGTG